MIARLILKSLLLVGSVFAVVSWGQGQSPDIKQKFAEAQKANQTELRTYTWQSRTVIKIKGETKKVKVEQVVYDVTGQQQKTLLEESPPGDQQESGGRLKKRIIAKKKEEYTEEIKSLGQLVNSYAHIPSEQMQAFIKNAQFSMGPGRSPLEDPLADYQVTIEIAGTNAVQQGDSMKIWIDKQTMMLRHVEVNTALDKNPVRLVVDYQSIPNGPTSMSTATIDYPDKKLELDIQNSDYQRVGQPGGGAPQPQFSNPATDKVAGSAAGSGREASVCHRHSHSLP